MAIKLFILSVIVVSLLLTNIKVETKEKIKNNQTTPNVVFYDSIAYEINEKDVTKVVQ